MKKKELIKLFLFMIVAIPLISYITHLLGRPSVDFVEVEVEKEILQIENRYQNICWDMVGDDVTITLYFHPNDSVLINSDEEEGLSDLYYYSDDKQGTVMVYNDESEVILSLYDIELDGDTLYYFDKEFDSYSYLIKSSEQECE